MAMNVEVLRRERIFDGFLNLDRAYLRHETPDGAMSPEVMRLNVERGDGAAVLLVNRDEDTVVLTRQFRYASWERGDGGSILEIPAGTVGPGQAPEDVARKEVAEEVGYRVNDLRFMLMFYASPGTSTERVLLYCGIVSNGDKVSIGGGLATEHEYIEVVHIRVEEALARLDRGDVTDAKTIIALQLLRQQRAPGGQRPRIAQKK
jgi:ADP-ribose pyrophosphatase